MEEQEQQQDHRYDDAMATIAETIGYLRSFTIPLLGNPYPRELSNRLSQAREALRDLINGNEVKDA